MDSLQLYRISDDYIDYLRKIDSSLLRNSEGINSRLYVGIVLELYNHKYFAPLSSYKPDKYDKVNNRTIHKVINNKGEHKAVIKLNCMFPVLDDVIELIDFKLEEMNYRYLLEQEFEAIEKDVSIIKTKASKLYEDVSIRKNKFYTKLSSNFKLLELEYKNYALPKVAMSELFGLQETAGAETVSDDDYI